MTEDLSLFDSGPATGAESTRRIFEHWQETVKGKSTARFTPGRRSKIEARQRSFSEEELLRAIDEAARDPFLNGENDRQRSYTDFKTIFRSDEKVEELLEAAARAPRRARNYEARVIE